MVKYREWLDKNYPGHNNGNIPNIKKVIADKMCLLPNYEV